MQFQDQTSQVEPSFQAYVPVLRPWIHEASNPYADWYFGDEEAADAFIGSWLVRPSSELYLGRAMMMFDELRRPIGCVIGMPGSQLARCRTADFAELCESLQSHPDADEIVAQTIEVSRELFPEVDDDEFYISRVAVSPDRRRSGLGRSMLGHAIESQRARGATRFRVDVSADNAAAIRLYESLGMRVTASARNADAELEYWSMTLAL
jgi:ribosomal protein S18 acetylase RimI-like enzyme